jgi:DNA-binding response OmpR family regulator
MANEVLALLSGPEICGPLCAAADRLGLTVTEADGELLAPDGLADHNRARLVVLDLDATSVVGVESCRKVRAFSDIPLIAMGHRADKRRVVEALLSGADCYLSKPLDPELLEAHMSVLLHRWSPLPGGSPPISVRGLTVDFARKEILLDGRPVAVTPAEYRLLACLAKQLGKVVSSSEMIREMSGYSCSEQEAQEIVKVHVSRLRSKLDRDPSMASYLLNVRGFGYLLERRTSPHRSMA